MIQDPAQGPGRQDLLSAVPGGFSGVVFTESRTGSRGPVQVSVQHYAGSGKTGRGP